MGFFVLFSQTFLDFVRGYNLKVLTLRFLFNTTILNCFLVIRSSKIGISLEIRFMMYG